jgi:two-component system response regulator HydG
VKGFTPQAMDLLIHHDWPGNIRELEMRLSARWCC